MKDKKKYLKGYSFTLTPEKVREFSKTSAKAKLDWLEEANIFVRKTLPTWKIKRWQKLAGR